MPSFAWVRVLSTRSNTELAQPRLRPQMLGASRKKQFPFRVDPWKSWVSGHSETHADPLEGSVAAQKSSLRTTYHTTAWRHLFSQQARREGVLHWVGGGAAQGDRRTGRVGTPREVALDKPSVLENGGLRRPTAGKRGMEGPGSQSVHSPQDSASFSKGCSSCFCT